MDKADPEEVSKRNMRLDSIDLQLIELLMSGYTARQGASILKKPVSTIQRRARLLVRNGMLKPTFELGYSKFGIKKGLLHVYMKDKISSAVDALLARDGILSASVHLGNSDIICSFVFKDSRDILDLIRWTKRLKGVESVVWSEEIYNKPTSRPSLSKILGNGA